MLLKNQEKDFKSETRSRESKLSLLFLQVFQIRILKKSTRPSVGLRFLVSSVLATFSGENLAFGLPNGWMWVKAPARLRICSAIMKGSGSA
jgi:hypothetical protein